ncbi:DUF4241 domain-containing protein [Nocardia paucivorans]|uniref:DUF4241 domain-containing protein n=1 Tax=Nocardia paucivorans TaxID=114259 RepID=UPI00031AE7DF|nr:DUF4241 domain-containing protein [Nocardia paucivorans]
MRPAHPDAFFTDGIRFRMPTGKVVVGEIHDKGHLVLPTGHLIAGDPTGLVFPEDFTAFTQTVPGGRYPLSLSTIRFVDDPDHVRVCAAVLRVGRTAATHWEQALLPGQDHTALREDEFFGFGVDGGMGCLFDASLLEYFATVLDDQPDGTTGWIELLCGDDPENRVAGTRVVTLAGPDGEPSLTAFESGFGDGAYPVWFGRDHAGDITSVVIDFLVLHGAERLDPATASVGEP